MVSKEETLSQNGTKSRRSYVSFHLYSMLGNALNFFISCREPRKNKWDVCFTCYPWYHTLSLLMIAFLCCKSDPHECDEVMKAIRHMESLEPMHKFWEITLPFGKEVSGNVKGMIKFSTVIIDEGGMGSYLEITEDISGSKCKLFFPKREITKSSKWVDCKVVIKGRKGNSNNVYRAGPYFLCNGDFFALFWKLWEVI